MKLVTIIIYMYIVYISLIDKCELMTFILYTWQLLVTKHTVDTCDNNEE